MDLTHETFIHASSIGNEAVAEAPFDVTHGDETTTVTRWMVDIEPPPFWAKQLGKPGNVDRWQIIQFQAPCTVAIDVGVAVSELASSTTLVARRGHWMAPQKVLGESC